MTGVPTAAGGRVAIVTLGCARNEVDSGQLGAVLHRAGHVVVDEAEDADVVIVNTCTFITPASQESVDTVLAACDLKGSGVRAVLVAGCMAERYGEELAGSIPEADVVIGFAAYPQVPAIVDAVLAGRPTPRFIGDGEPRAATTLPLLSAGSRRSYLPQDELDRIPESGPRFPLRTAPDRPWSYLKIASGCDRTCTFCAIPSWRGAFRSRPLEEVATEARWLVDSGAVELVLVSENTTSWGKDLPGGARRNQPALLEALDRVDGLERVRLMYLQPAELRRELLEAMAATEVAAPYFDLSLQHVSAPVLERMQRTGSPERFRALVEEIRDLAPDAVFRSNFIVGFPGESDEDVAALADFLTDARLDWVGLFAFSPQEGTPAETMADQVPEDIALERLRYLTDLQEAIADEAARAFVGRRLDVTVEADEDGYATGRSYREAPETDGEIRLVAPGEHGWQPARVPVGRTVPVEVVASDGVDLLAVPDVRGVVGSGARGAA